MCPLIDGQPIACFQPFIDTATGLIAGVEALGRMRQADGQLLSVGPLFVDPKIPPATLRRLDRQIRDDALARLPEAPADWFLSLNISPRWISRLRPNQPLPSLKQLQQHGVDPHRVVFEITELGGGNQRLPEVVARYRDAGARIAIDDFGAGHASLEYLKKFSFDVLKIDRSYIANLVESPVDRVLVAALCEVGRVAGIEIVAEGVETEEQFQLLKTAGCTLYQGYLLGRPAPLSRKSISPGMAAA